MERFQRLSGKAVVIMEDDVDTDVIYPARFLLRMDKKGLGSCFFHDRRNLGGAPFVLDEPGARGASILIAGTNFGCGSSREHAVWSLVDAGFRCVIAPSFGEIFYANCLKNGVLPIRLAPGDVAALANIAKAGAPFEIDLEALTVASGNGALRPFSIDPNHRDMLLNGWDEIDLILRSDGPAIDAFEASHRQASPWLFSDEPG